MKNKLALIIPALILCVGIGVAYKMIKEDRVLPIYSPAMINPELVDESKQNVTKGHRIADFKLINQDGEEITNKDFDGFYYVTDFFFTTCPTICPSMSAQMQRVQKKYMDDEDFKILSHTVQPEVDSVPVLKEYANLYEANPNKWIFVTGSKKVIYDLARKSYFAAVTEGDGGPNDFIHTENFVLVDKDKRIRGFYDGTSSESVDKLIVDIEILQQEYD
ncbi:MAG: protein SCO1/2 [Vicingaceae bacterium]|jgi:protein SCO1/2